MRNDTKSGARPITRRAVLGSASAATLAGIIPNTIAPTTVSADPIEEPRPRTVVLAPMHAQVVHVDDLAVESRRLFAQHASLARQRLALYEQLLATLSSEQRDLLRRLDNVAVDDAFADQALRFAELARHMPGLYPVLRMIWMHIDLDTDRVGTCCTVDYGFEP